MIIFHPSKPESVYMQIKILGTGCTRCKLLEINVITAVEELGLEAEVKKVEDIMDIMAYQIPNTPGLVIDDEVITAGRILSVSQIKEILIKEQS
jgi:small redox-active disulfide protein 2